MATKPVAKTAFEDEFVAMIEDSERTFDEVLENYNEGCMLCTLYGRQADCSACPIHEAAVAMAKWHGSPRSYEWLSEEGVLA